MELLSLFKSRFERQLASDSAAFEVPLHCCISRVARVQVLHLSLQTSACFSKLPFALFGLQTENFHSVCSEAGWKRPSTGVEYENVIIRIYKHKHTLLSFRIHTSFPKRPLFLSARKWSQLWRAKNSSQCVGLVPKHTHMHAPHTHSHVHTFTHTH